METKTFIIAGGCFWGVQKYFNSVKGVVNTIAGYTGGDSQNPKYKEVCSGSTGHCEAVLIEYNPKETNIIVLMKHFFSIVDPTALNYQGNDIGSHYRSAVYYNNEDEKEILEQIFEIANKRYDNQIVTECLPVEDFWTAEEYHQNFLYKNPKGYCHIPSFKYRFSSYIDDSFKDLTK